jgi:hypothetical protein
METPPKEANIYDKANLRILGKVTDFVNIQILDEP